MTVLISAGCRCLIIFSFWKEWPKIRQERIGLVERGWKFGWLVLFLVKVEEFLRNTFFLCHLVSHKPAGCQFLSTDP